MNTADQNVFTLDTAFKRRWRMICIPNDISKCDFANDPICATGISWASFLSTINDKIVEFGEGSIGSEDKRLGPFFIKKEELADSKLFSEKILMYLWSDAFKNDHDRVFRQDYKTLEQLIAGFNETQFGVFVDDITFNPIFSLPENELNNSSVTPEHYLSGKTEASRSLYSKTINAINKKDIEYSIGAVRDYLSLKAPNGRIAAEFHLQSSGIKLIIKEPASHDCPIGRKLPDTYRWTKDYEIIYDDSTDIDIVIDAIMDSYNQVKG